MRLTPPPRLPPIDPLESELQEMSIAIDRGFPHFPPPPPPPVDRHSLARVAPSALMHREETIDWIRLLARILLCTVLALLLFAAWSLY